MKNLLLEYIQLISEAHSVTLENGSVVEYGSDEHISDLEEMVRRLEFYRNRHGKGSVDRDVFARPRNKLAARIKKLKRKREGR